MQLQPPPEPFSWTREVIVPAVFTVLGAAVGFFATQLRDELQATRAKRSFMRAVARELDALGDQLDSSLLEVMSAKDRVENGGQGPHIAAASLRTAVFKSQIDKIREVDDALMIRVIHFYSDLGTLENIIDGVNALSGEYNRAGKPSDQHSPARGGVLSSLRVLEERTQGACKSLNGLRTEIDKWLRQPESTFFDVIDKMLEKMTER